MKEQNPLLEPENIIPGCKVIARFRMCERSKFIINMGMYLMMFSIAMLLTLTLFPDTPSYYYDKGFIVLVVGIVLSIFGNFYTYDSDKYFFRVTIPEESLSKMVNHYFIVGKTEDGMYDILPCNYKFKIDFMS